MSIRAAAGVLLAAILMLASPASAASFDCALARSPTEKLICGDPRISRADDALAAAYAELLALAPAPEAIRRQQREWLADTRNKASGAAALLSAYVAYTAVLREQIEALRFTRSTHAAPASPRSCLRLPGAQGPCTVSEAGSLAGAPGPELSYQVQVYAKDSSEERQGVAVLAAAAPGQVRVVAWLATEGARYGVPEVAHHAGVPLLYLPGTSGGSGNFPDDALFAWHDGGWRQVDTASWLETLAKRLPRGLFAAKGIYPDWATMTAATDLWRQDDPNCCPGGGSARIGLRLEGDRVLFDSISVSRARPR